MSMDLEGQLKLLDQQENTITYLSDEERLAEEQKVADALLSGVGLLSDQQMKIFRKLE